MDAAQAPHEPTCLDGTILDDNPTINELPAAAAPMAAMAAVIRSKNSPHDDSHG
jgi:hypothetical protein